MSGFLSAQNASLIYHDHEKEVFACRDLTVDIERGEFVGILGPSGSGKSSMLYLLSGLKTPTRGEVLFQGENLNELPDEKRSQVRLKEFGFVFQQPYLLGYLTAAENVLVAETSGDRSSLRRALNLLEKLGLAEKAHRHPHELSGGERQRVCVARSLFGNPKIIFADEPTAALDHKNGEHVVELLEEHRGDGALVMVTHDPTMLKRADRVLEIVEGSLAERAAVSSMPRA